ncbi:16979_t:CDS:1, partial [Racocetra persica]
DNHYNLFENELDPHYFLPKNDPDNFSEEESYNSLDFSEHINKSESNTKSNNNNITSSGVIIISDSEVETTYTTYEKRK